MLPYKALRPHALSRADLESASEPPRPPAPRFISDLDETHLFIGPAGLPFIKEELKRFSEANHYTDPQES